MSIVNKTGLVRVYIEYMISWSGQAVKDCRTKEEIIRSQILVQKLIPV